MALIMALGIMLVLVIALTTVITFTAAGARDAHRVNAGQKATALAEGGVNNALAVLTKNYENGGPVVYPGNANLLPERKTAYDGGTCTAPVNNCVTWSGTLAGPLAPSALRPWKYEWRLTATGAVRNPTVRLLRR